MQLYVGALFKVKHKTSIKINNNRSTNPYVIFLFVISNFQNIYKVPYSGAIAIIHIIFFIMFIKSPFTDMYFEECDYSIPLAESPMIFFF